MIWHLHDFGKWEDVNLGEKPKPTALRSMIVVRQVITQQRRCVICNLVETRHS